MLIFKEIQLLPEIFLGISIIYLIIHGTFISVNNKYLLIQNSVLYLSVLIISLFCFLLINNTIECNDFQIFNNTIIIDYLGSFSKILIAIVSIFCFLMIQRYLTVQKINYFEYSVLILFALLGIFFICSSNDLITAYLAIELQSLSFYIMAALKKDSAFSVDAGLKYFILGAFSSSLFLFGSSILYGVSGTTNFEDLKNLFFLVYSSYDCTQDASDYTFVKDVFIDGGLIQFALSFIFVSLLFKLAIAPFHLWSIDVYEGSPSSSTFFFAVVPKLAIFILLVRIFYSSFFEYTAKWRYYIVILAVLTIVVGSFAGLEQKKLKSLLAYSSISHMGYTLIAFSTGTFEGLQMLFCYLFLYMIAGLCIWSIFLMLQLKYKYVKKQNKDLADLSSLSKSNNILALFFSTVLLSIAGLPPMVGFLVKIGIFLVSIEVSMYFVSIVSILCSVISTFYYIRIVKIMFFENSTAGKLYQPIKSHISIVIVCLFYFLLFLFINPTLIYLFSYKITLLLTMTMM
uniref:NADH dehydrogenase subunit 2 n=1 Tax=Thalassiosira pseudonana TaxID=35128 RepID=A0A8F1B707_THAPS|nr:NADH dehydrogenase subunit 2 [Thalassiosira pseudonana]